MIIRLIMIVLVYAWLQAFACLEGIIFFVNPYHALPPLPLTILPAIVLFAAMAITRFRGNSPSAKITTHVTIGAVLAMGAATGVSSVAAMVAGIGMASKGVEAIPWLLGALLLVLGWMIWAARFAMNFAAHPERLDSATVKALIIAGAVAIAVSAALTLITGAQSPDLTLPGLQAGIASLSAAGGLCFVRPARPVLEK